MNTYNVKFFGSKEHKGQIKQVKLTVDAPSAADVENALRGRYGYRVINGLKIRQV